MHKRQIQPIPDMSRTDNNIGAVRYILALAVFIAHYNLLSGHDIPFPVTSYQGVGGFFAISGFLIFKSYHRAEGNTMHYLRNRALRILPSYFFIVIAATLILSAVSSLGITDYFRSHITWRYLTANIAFLNFLQPSLPGVFEDGITNAVNGSLWTMKVEWALYLSVPAAAWFILRRGYRPWIVIGIIYILATAYRWGFLALYQHTGISLYEILSRQFLGQMTFFYAGVLLYCYFDHLKKFLPVIGAISLAVIVSATIVRYDSAIYVIVLYPAALSAVVLTLGLWGRWGTPVARLEDCSYEIYLFHYPVIQLFTRLNIFNGVPGWILFFSSFMATWILAYICARYVSGPLRHRFRTAYRQ
ncbi:MAG: acyltransferase [Muribaculum sp.]|nr:acyltransferase [Muribaculum sp.]